MTQRRATTLPEPSFELQGKPNFTLTEFKGVTVDFPAIT
jgi:hypothetical protein